MAQSLRIAQYTSDNEVITIMNGWYEELEENVPNTNNALEARNQVVKDEDTIRERLPFLRLTVVVF